MQTANLVAFLADCLSTIKPWGKYFTSPNNVSNKGTQHKKMGFKKLIIIGLLLGGQQSLAQAETTNGSLTLNGALKRALEKNPSLKVYDFRNTVLDGELETANLKPAYQLGFDIENFAGSDELNGINGAELTVSLSSVLEMGNKRAARRGIVSTSRFVSDAQKQVESLSLLGEVTRHFVDVLAAQEYVVLAKEADTLAKETLNIVKKRAKVGAAPDAEVNRAKAAAAQATLRLMSTQQQLEYLNVSLSALWGDMTPGFASINGDLFSFGTDIEFETLFAKVSTNPAIQIYAANERLKEAEIRLAKIQSKNDISWSIGVRRFQESDNTALVAGFSMPIFSSNRNSGAVYKALAQRNEITVQKELALISLHKQLFRAFNNRKQAIVATNVLKKTIIPALNAALKETRRGYQRGRYRYLEYVSARQELLNARRMMIESAATALTYGAEIEQLTAEPLAANQYHAASEFSGSK